MSNKLRFQENLLITKENVSRHNEQEASMQFQFPELPKTETDFRSMPTFGFDSPFQVAALLIVALTSWKDNREECYQMIDALKGPQKMSPMDRQFVRDRMMSKGDYLAKAYFNGATPENNYTPSEPFTIEVKENPYTYDDPGYARVQVITKGADSPRYITLRQKGEEWFLWEFAGILSDIRKPKEEDPWT